MSNKKNLLKLTLAAKLANKSKVIKHADVNNEKVKDIEDLVTSSPTSTKQPQYFSPLKTRNQRKNTPVNAASPVKVNKPLDNKIKNIVKTKKTVAPKEIATKIETKASTSKAAVKQKLDNENDLNSEPPNKVKATNANESGDYKCNWTPPGWLDTLENIRQMRNNVMAPVDSMGCHKCADGEADPKTQRFHKLVALMLSSQTKDEVTFAAMSRLRMEALTPSSIVAMPVDTLATLLHPVSFYRNKSKYIKQTAEILINKYDSDIPNNIKELVALPGVGPKMAHICMATAWNEITGIGVDVHVHRISNRLKWVPKPTKEPEQTRKALESWLPQDYWSDVNHLLVGFGQTICTPLRPKCDQCLNATTCPSASKSANQKSVKESKAKILSGR